MKISIINLAVALVFFLGFTATSAYAGTFSDNFNNGNTDGWISTPQGTGYPLGNWRVSNEVLIQDAGPDHVKFLVNNLPLTNQSIETKIYFHDMGYAGITIWRNNIDNWVDIYIYPAGSYLRVLELIDGIRQEANYPFTSDKNRWYTMRVDANSLTGELAIYLDGVLITNQTVATSHRTGLSGVNSGNAGGSFDDFVIIADSPTPTPTNHPTNVNLFQITTESSQQKDAFVYKDLVAYDSLSDIWGYNLETKQNFPIIQKDGQQYITHLYKNLVVYQDIPTDAKGDIRVYNVKTGKDTLIIGEPNSYSSGGTNGDYVIYLDGGACGSLYAYNINRKKTEHIIDNVCTPRISDNIVFWAENATGGPDIRGYNLKSKKYLNIVTENGFQGPSNMFDGKLVYKDGNGGGRGSYMAMKVKDLRTNEVQTVYETSTNSIDWPSISNNYVVWSESPADHINSVKGVNLRTREIFTVQEPGPHQNSHTSPSIWKNTAVWMSWRTGNGDIYGATLTR